MENNCYLEESCKNHYQSETCYEIEQINFFRYNQMDTDILDLYYELSPQVINYINESENKDLIYESIYNSVVLSLVDAIEQQDYALAHIIYNTSFITFEEELKLKKKQNIKIHTLF